MKRNKFENGKKTCPGCNEEKARESYYSSKGQATSRCKTCVDAQNSAWREANPEKARLSQFNWKRQNEGRTYLDKATGYVLYVGTEHPVASARGLTRLHRVVLFDKIGPGEHECHWGCGKSVSWERSYPKHLDGLVVDHLNGVRDDNRPENLVPACNACNNSRRKKDPSPCSFQGCKNDAKTHGYCGSHYAQEYNGKELTPLRRKVMAHSDESGRVCTECSEYKTYDNYSKTSGGDTYRSKCKKCLSSLALKNRDSRLARGIPCSENGCKKPAMTMGQCVTHYHRAYYEKKRAC